MAIGEKLRLFGRSLAVEVCREQEKIVPAAAEDSEDHALVQASSLNINAGHPRRKVSAACKLTGTRSAWTPVDSGVLF